jgi:hypothetical protein
MEKWLWKINGKSRKEKKKKSCGLFEKLEIVIFQKRERKGNFKNTRGLVFFLSEIDVKNGEKKKILLWFGDFEKKKIKQSGPLNAFYRNFQSLNFGDKKKHDSKKKVCWKIFENQFFKKNGRKFYASLKNGYEKKKKRKKDRRYGFRFLFFIF